MELSLREIKDRLIKYSKNIGIDKIGFTTGEPFQELRPILEENRVKGFESGLEEKDLERRIDPSLSLPCVKSIIAIAVAYPNQDPANSFGKEQRAKAMFSRSSWGKDYHLVLTEKLSLLAQYLKDFFPHCQTEIMVDTGPLSDRAVARRAGLGWIGKNGSLITKEMGSFVFLGELLTDIPFEPDESVEQLCGTCRRCQISCPVQAIQEKALINCQRCLAFQTINKKPIQDDIKNKIAENKYIYGCDVCQLVCPFNQGKFNHWHGEFKSNFEIIYPSLQELLKISNKEFNRKYGTLSGSWRGKKVLQRNALFIMGKEKDQRNIPLYKEVVLQDPRGDIRAAAVWALGNYQSVDVENFLKEILLLEEDPLVISEIKKILSAQGVLLDNL